MIVREAEIEDLERTMQVLDAGRQHMRGEGNAVQWVNGYPSPELIRRDIEQGQLLSGSMKRKNRRIGNKPSMVFFLLSSVKTQLTDILKTEAG